MAELPILTTDCRKEVMQIEIVYTRPILTKRKFYLLTMKYNYITASYKEQSPQFRAWLNLGYIAHYDRLHNPCSKHTSEI